MEVIPETIDYKELGALLHQSEMFAPHLLKQLRNFTDAECNRDCSMVRVMDIGCGPCPSMHVIMEELVTKEEKRVEIVAIDQNKHWLDYCRNRYLEYPATFIQSDFSSHLDHVQLSTLHKIHEFFELGICLFSVQALNSMFSVMNNNAFNFVDIKFLLVHAFTVCQERFESTTKRCGAFYERCLDKNIRDKFNVYSCLSCPVELNENTAQEILQSVENKLREKSEETFRAAAELKGNLYFVSLLLINKNIPLEDSN